MTRVLAGLQPEPLWRYFEELCTIPPPSKHEAAIGRYLADTGRRLGLATTVDALGNVIIAKPATAGMEDRAAVCLQSHMDMVPQKNPEVAHDFLRDPICPRIDGALVRATGTTLGADNGIGLAASLAVLESKQLAHGPIEVLVTVDEEAGMSGAKGLAAGLLRSRTMLNLDGESETELCIGCAGGLDTLATLPAPEEPVPAGHVAFLLEVAALRGGHSGIDIHLGRGNAVQLIARLIWQVMREHEVRLASIAGGDLRNVIPRSAQAVLILPAVQAEPLAEKIATGGATIRAEFAATDPDIRISAGATELPSTVIAAEPARKLIEALFACPNAVVFMSPDVPGMAETSSNLAAVKTEGGVATITTLQRSAVDSRKIEIADRVAAIFTLAGGEASHAHGYSGWRPNAASPLLALMKATYVRTFNREPEIVASHGGLECGIIMGAYPGLDTISFGPTIRFPHSPDEHVDIASVACFWRYLTAVLEAMPRG
jgi:dipeptidase D